VVTLPNWSPYNWTPLLKKFKNNLFITFLAFRNGFAYI
jgi:hypothetical protein